jgi:putative glutamine amidotransferase
MVKILVPLAVFEDKKHFPTHGMRDSYLRKLISFGVEPVLLPSSLPDESIKKFYDECSGILLMGGKDIDPKYYGADIEPKTEIEYSRRDEVEISLAKMTVKDKKPFLGICRGLQVLNVAQGGTLTQHLPDRFPTEKHGISEGGNYDDLKGKDCAHTININTDSNLGKFINKPQITVACGHHQCIDKIGNELKIGASSPVGVIESIEHTEPNYFCLGVQFHPEVSETPELEPIFAKFIEASRNWKG